MAAKTSALLSFTWAAAVTEDTFDFTDAAAGGFNVTGRNRPQYVMITNLDTTAANFISVRFDNIAAVSAADGCIIIPANQFRIIRHLGNQLRLIAAAGTPLVNVTRVSNPLTPNVVP
jgi:hypothetical protein